MSSAPLEWLTDGPRAVDVQYLVNTIRAVAQALIAIDQSVVDSATISHLACSILDEISSVERTLQSGSQM